MQKVLIEKRRGLFDLRALYCFFRNAVDGMYRISVTKVRKPRSNDQNGWLWGCIYPMLLDALLDEGWEFTSTEQVHEFFKAQMTADKVVNKHTGEIIEFPNSTATMDTVTFSTYCEKLREYAREYLNIEIPDPDRYWKSYEKDIKLGGIGTASAVAGTDRTYTSRTESESAERNQIDQTDTEKAGEIKGFINNGKYERINVG